MGPGPGHLCHIDTVLVLFNILADFALFSGSDDTCSCKKSFSFCYFYLQAKCQFPVKKSIPGFWFSHIK